MLEGKIIWRREKSSEISLGRGGWILVCLQETKIKDLSPAYAYSLGVGIFADWKVMGGEKNSRGGILLFWDRIKLEQIEVETGLFSITCLFKNVEDMFQWAFIGVYSLVENSKRELFWEELGALKSLWEDPWCLERDFNVTFSPYERNRGDRLFPSMRRFSKILNELGLRDLPLQGGHFTWRGGLNRRLMSLLDRFLVTVDWEIKFSKVVQCSLPRPVSDHNPVMLDTKGITLRPCTFRFKLMLLKFEEFKDLLRIWWQSLHFTKSFSFILASKLKALKGILKVWNKEVFSRAETKKEALRRISIWDDLEKEKADLRGS